MSREFWLAVRQALLIIIGAIESEYGINPSTKECREFMRRTDRRVRG